jgi:hypothetical protein
VETLNVDIITTQVSRSPITCQSKLFVLLIFLYSHT